MPKPRAHDAFGDRLAHQELLRALAGLVVVVDQAVVGRLEAVELLGLAADRERGEQHVVAAVGGRRLVLAGIEHFEGIARLHLALEIDVVGVDADQILDDRLAGSGCAARFRRRFDRASRRRVVVVGVVLGGCRPLRCRRSSRRPARICRCRTAPPPLRSRLSLARITRIGCGRCRRASATCRMRSFCAFLDAAVAAARAEHIDDRLDRRRRWAPRSRSIEATLSPFFATMTRSLKGLPPVVSLVVFGSSVMFSGTMRASKPA